MNDSLNNQSEKYVLGNPYIAGNPISDENGFFDRTEIMNWVNRELLASGASVLVIRGQRRIGKTTILLQLKRTLPKDSFLPVFFDLQDQAGKPLKHILSELAEEMMDALGENRRRKRVALPKTDDNGRIFKKEFLPNFLEKISPRRLVILTDEFDVLNDVTSANTLFQYFSKLTIDHSKLAFVIATGRDPSDLSKDYNAIFKGALTEEIWVLDRNSTIDLIKQSEKNHTLSFDAEAIERILTLTHYHPFLTQLLCQRIWQRAHYSSENQSEAMPQIGFEEVDSVVDEVLRAGELQLSWVWDGLSDDEKIYIAALAEISDEGKSITEDEVVGVLSKYAERFRSYRLDLAPLDLEKRNILEKTEKIGVKEYRFYVELVRRWVCLHRSLKAVIDDLDKSNQPAERLFLVGLSFFERQQWDLAKQEFERALQEKPDHIRSLLNLGDTLIKMERFEEAIVVLDKAHKLEPEDGRLPLSRALVSMAQDLNKRGEDEQALELSEKALRLSPNDGGAKSIKTSVWNRRGDDAIEKENISLALEAYQKAGNKDKVQNIYNMQAKEIEKFRVALHIDPSLISNNERDVKASICSLAVSPDNIFVSSGTDDGKIVLWATYPGHHLRTYDGHFGRVNCIQYSENGNLLASGSDDNNIIIWDPSIMRRLQILSGHEESVQSLAFSPDQTILASGSKDGKVILWHLASNQKLQTRKDHDRAITCVRFVPGSQQLLVTSSLDAKIIILDLSNFEKRVLEGSTAPINTIAISPDGKYLASGSADADIVLWNIEDGEIICSLVGHHDEIVSLAFSSDSSILASGSKDAKVILWHVLKRQQISTFGDSEKPILKIAFSHETEPSLVVGGADSLFQVWKIWKEKA